MTEIPSESSRNLTRRQKGERQWDTCHIYDLDYDEAPPDPDNAPAPTTNKTVRCPRMYDSPSRWEFDHSFYQWTIVEHVRMYRYRYSFIVYILYCVPAS